LQIPNYSPVTFDLGNQSFNLKVGTLVIGAATIYDLTLVPGSNSKTLLGALDFGTLINNIEYVLNTSALALAAGNVRLLTTGKSTIYNGQHIPYYEKILGGLELQADIPITQLLVGTLGGYLNGSAAGLQNIINQIGPALVNGTVSVAQLSTTLQTAYANGTGSIQDISNAVGEVFTSAGALDLGSLLTALGDTAQAVSSGVTNTGDILGGVGTALGNGASTIADIITALNLTALIPVSQPAAT
jgi:hypothetical protein